MLVEKAAKAQPPALTPVDSRLMEDLQSKAWWQDIFASHFRLLRENAQVQVRFPR